MYFLGTYIHPHNLTSISNRSCSDPTSIWMIRSQQDIRSRRRRRDIQRSANIVVGLKYLSSTSTKVKSNIEEVSYVQRLHKHTHTHTPSMRHERQVTHLHPGRIIQSIDRWSVPHPFVPFFQLSICLYLLSNLTTTIWWWGGRWCFNLQAIRSELY